MADKSKRKEQAKEKAKKSEINEKLDEESEESFPASDPPAYMGSAAIARFPKENEGDAPKKQKSKATSAERKRQDEKKRPQR